MQIRIEDTDATTQWLLVLVVVGGMVCAFLAGEDDALDEISYAERLRVMCATPGHSETMCHNTAQGRTNGNR